MACAGLKFILATKICQSGKIKFYCLQKERKREREVEKNYMKREGERERDRENEER